jgi:hypothetical protein
LELLRHVPESTFERVRERLPDQPADVGADRDHRLGQRPQLVPDLVVPVAVLVLVRLPSESVANRAGLSNSFVGAIQVALDCGDVKSIGDARIISKVDERGRTGSTNGAVGFKREPNR